MSADSKVTEIFRSGWLIKALIVCIGILIIVVSMIRLDMPAADLVQKYKRTTSKFVTINNTLVHFMDEGRGPVLLLLHGVSASAYVWDGWTTHLKKNFRVIRMDLPGSGLTGPLPDFDYRIKSFVTFLKVFCDKLQLKKFHLAGNSLGGGMAWNYALENPDQVQKLILVGSIGYPPAPGLINKISESQPAGFVMQYITPRFAVKSTMQMVYHNSSLITEAEVNRHHELMLRRGNRKALYTRLQNQHEILPVEQIRLIQNETLLLWGEHDTVVPLNYARRFKADIPKSKLIIYPDAGHVIMQEIPNMTANDVHKFLMHEALLH